MILVNETLGLKLVDIFPVTRDACLSKSLAVFDKDEEEGNLQHCNECRQNKGILIAHIGHPGSHTASWLALGLV